jgi:hypothetical protein
VVLLILLLATVVLLALFEIAVGEVSDGVELSLEARVRLLQLTDFVLQFCDLSTIVLNALPGHVALLFRLRFWILRRAA